MADFAIRNALIVDGTGKPGFYGSVAVKGDKIVEVGTITSPGSACIDAEGLVLVPGIIDSHTHFDAQITWDPMVSPSVAHGVTTVLIGNCGFTIAPCKPEHRDITMRNLVRVEGMSLKAMELGIDWAFESFPDYLNLLESKGVGPNVGAFVGHSSVRTYVMGEEAAHRSATDVEVSSMKEIVAKALRAGAVGFATSTSPSHNGADGHPMPSRLADKNELRQLAGVLGEQHKGVFMLTKGGSTPIQFLESLAAEIQRPVIVAALLHNSTDPEGVFRDLSQINDARSRNNILWGQVSCCPLSTEFTLKAPYPFEGLSAWQPAMQADSEVHYKKLLSNESFRSNIRNELTQPAAVRLFNGEWDKLKVLEVIQDSNRSFEDRSIAEITQKSGEDPLDFLLNLSLQENLETTFLSVLLNSDENAVTRLLTHPYSSIALSDAGAHLTFFCDAGFGLHLLGYWVRDRQIMSLEEGVYRLTGQPTQIYGMPGRGCIAPGAYADLLLFDPEQVGRSRARRTNDLPGGQRRLTTDPQGVHGVWINGTQVWNDAGPVDIDHYPGQILRRYDS